MPDTRKARSRGHDIEVTVHDNGDPVVIVDGEDVPVRVVDGKYAVAYLSPEDDLLEGARKYAERL
jgi:hypothetical protein